MAGLDFEFIAFAAHENGRNRLARLRANAVVREAEACFAYAASIIDLVHLHSLLARWKINK